MSGGSVVLGVVATDLILPAPTAPRPGLRARDVGVVDPTGAGDVSDGGPVAKRALGNGNLEDAVDAIVDAASGSGFCHDAQPAS